MVQLAKAEVRENANPSQAMRQLARINEDDAEGAVHKLFKTHGLVPPVEITEVDLGFPKLNKFPVLKLTDWVQYLLDSGQLWRQMTGCSTYEKMTSVLTEFWNRFRVLFPDHGIFDLASQGTLDLECTIPVYSHTDEGRSLKKQPIWMISVHGCLGRGSRPFLETGRGKAPLLRNSMGMNFTGGAFSTHFIFATMLKSVSDCNPGSLDKLLELFAKDAEAMLRQGVTSKDLSKQVWLCHLNTKGDLPALSRLGSFKRTFLRAPKAQASKKPASGICHLCLAGVERVSNRSRNESPWPFEELSMQPAWLQTLGREDPWDELPTILRGVSMGNRPLPFFFAVDLWHCYHLGLGKHWIASSLVSIIETLPLPNTNSVVDKLEWVNQRHQEFIRVDKPCGWIRKIDKDYLNFPSSNVCPIGSWNKGSVTTHLMKFLEWLCDQHVTGRTDSELLRSIVSWLCPLCLAFRFCWGCSFLCC